MAVKERSAMRSGPLYSHRKDDLDEQSRQLKLKKVNCALRFSWLILRMSTSSSAWSSRQLPALRCRCGWVTSSADAMRPASASCLQSQNREAKASVAGEASGREKHLMFILHARTNYAPPRNDTPLYTLLAQRARSWSCVTRPAYKPV